MWLHHLLPAIGAFAWAVIMAWAFRFNRRKWRTTGKTYIRWYGDVDKEWAYRLNLTMCLVLGVIAIALAIFALTAGAFQQR